jgi:hypothetical protein
MEEEDILLGTLSRFPGSIFNLCLDQHGTHFIQQIISVIPEWRRKPINFAIFQDFQRMATNMYGVCVLKHFIQQNQDYIFINCMISNICLYMNEISCNQYGNYIIQYLIELFYKINKNDFEMLIQAIEASIMKLSTNKFAYNILEKCLTLLGYENRIRIIRALFYSRGFLKILKNKYGIMILKTASKFIDYLQKREYSEIFVIKLYKENLMNSEKENLLRMFNMLF